MGIFGDSTVVGLFDDERDLERAVAALQEDGFAGDDGGDLAVIDRARFAGREEAAIGEAPVRAPFDPTRNPFTPHMSQPASVEAAVRDALVERGLGEEESSFFARNVAEGARLLIVDADPRRSEEAWRLMSEANARTVTH